ncbi:MAG: hypothetical protein ACOX9C_10685 [Kiritimatiellia bacterium]|jgi:hypothetical protein
MNSRSRQLAAGAAIIALAAACGFQSQALRQTRRTQLTHQSVGYSADVPPVVTFVTVSLGGFRGIISDLLWLRASRLQEERRFVELVQLSGWVTRLEPHNPEVWTFHAWNLAYNVSVMMSRPEDRWRWILNGIEMLRDQGVPLNPRNATIHRELGWIFQHKLGYDGDPGHAYYRTDWARRIAPCLGGGGSRPAPSSPAATELESRFKMEVKTMAEIEARFGRIDWRVPMAQSLYWGWKGLAFADDRERLPCRRMVYVSLMEMARRQGRLLGDPQSENWTFAVAPSTAVIEPTLDFIEETMAEHRFNGIRYAYMGLLRDAMRIRVAEKRNADALRIYARFTAFLSGKTDAPLPTFQEALAADDALFERLLLSAGF